MGDDKKRVKKQGQLTMRQMTEEIQNILGEIRDMRLTRETARMTAPVNASAKPLPPVVKESLFRVTTNGKRFQIECSRNGGEIWMPVEWENYIKGKGFKVVPLERRSYRAAVKCIRKEYGTSAIILKREWRAV